MSLVRVGILIAGLAAASELSAATPDTPESALAGGDAPESAPAPAAERIELGPTLIEGRVLEAGTREPLADAEVLLPDLGLATSTGEDGRFRIEGEPVAGDIKVLVAVPGYISLEQMVPPAKKGTVRSVRVHLRRDPKAPMRTTVRTKPATDSTKRTVTREDVETLPGALGDPVRTVFNLPGVARAPLGLPLLIVRGSEPGDTRIYTEGHPIPVLFHFGVVRTSLNGVMLEAVEFYPGAMPLRYGRSHGGALELRLRDDIPDRLVGGHIQSDLLDTEVFAAVALGKKYGVYASFRRSYIDALLKTLGGPFLEDLGLTVAPRYLDYSVLFIGKPSPRHTLRFIWFGSDDRAVIVDADDEQDEIRFATLYHRGLFLHEARLPGGIRNNFSISVGFTRLRFAFQQVLDAKLNSWDLALREELVVPLGDKLKVAVGLDLLVGLPKWDIFIDGGIFDDEEEGNNFDLNATELTPDVSAYFQLLWEPVQGLRVMPGMRVDYFFLADNGSIDLRVMSRWKLHDMVTAKASAGRYGEPPTVFDTGIGPDRAIVADSWSFQWTLGVEVRPIKPLLIDLELFHKELFNLEPPLSFGGIAGRGSDETEGGDPFDPTRRDRRGRVIGAELLIRLDPFPDVPVTGWIAYTLSKSLRWERDSDEKPEPSTFDQPHILALVVQWSPGKGWLFSGRYRFVSGNFYDKVTPGPWDADLDRWSSFPAGRERLPPFHSLDLRVEKRFTFDTWKLGLYLEVLNVYNRRNPEGVIYSADNREQEFTRGLPIIPLIGVRGSF